MARVKENGQQPVASEAEVDNKIAISSKVLVEDEKRKRKLHENLPKMSAIQKLMDRMSGRIRDNSGMMELLPDLRLAKRIMVASILSPKDLVGYELNLTVNDAFTEEELPGELITELQQHFCSTFNLEGRLATILSEALFDTGAYAMVVVPENALEGLVNSGKLTGMESYEQFVAGNPQAFGRRNLLSTKPYASDYLEITDNINYLKLRKVQRQALSNSVRHAVGMENYVSAPMVSFRSGQGADPKRDSNPLVMRAPADSIIPVHVPGDPSDHLGYYLAVDGNGMPVTQDSSSDALGELRERLTASANNNALGGLIEATGLNFSKDQAKAEPNAFIDQYIQHVESELESQLKDGVYGEEVKVSRPSEVYYLMLTRALAMKKTRLVYLPKEMVSYFAFDYDEYGLGMSLLEQTKVFGSLRAILLFADVMSGVKNSVGHTRLDVTLDEDDPDHAATLEAVVQQYSALQTNQLPIGVLNPSDIVRALQKASVDVNVDGGEAFPGTKTNIEDMSRSRTVPDDTLRENLRRMQYSGLGIPPEIVDSAMEGDLATVVVSRNLMFAKQVMEYQNSYELMLAEFIQTYIRCSGELVGKIRTALEGAKIEVTDQVINDYIQAISVRLPAPDLAKIQSQAEAYNEYSDAIDRAVEAYITEDMLAELMDGEINARALGSLRISVASVLKRDWMRGQNVFTEIDELFNDPDIKLADRINSHSKDVIEALGDVMHKLFKQEDGIMKKLDELNEGPGADAGGGDSAGGTDDDDGGFGGGFSF